MVSVAYLFEIKYYKTQLTDQERKTFQKYFRSNKTASDQQGWFTEPRERQIHTHPICKGRSYRPKAFRFSFHKNIDRYRIFHCPRGRGYSLCVLGVTTINYTIFSLSVDQKINVPGDHTFPIFCDRNWFPLVVSENGFNHRGKGALPLRFKHRPHRFLYHSETFFQFSCRLLGVKHRPEPDLVMGALC